MAVIGNKWDEILGSEYARPYFDALMEKVKAEYRTHTVFPPFDLMFAALKTVDYERIWNEEAMSGDNTVAVHIRHIREKIEINPRDPRYLKVVWGVGYKIEKQ